MQKISAFIITKNEELNIAKAINSLKKATSEIIVVDSGSTDNTVKIAKDLGANVVFNEWPGYVKQKTFGESLCQNDWILNLDGDEELSAELQDEIEFIFASNNQDHYLAYRINFVIMHILDSKPRFLAPNNQFIRLYNRKFSSFANTAHYSTHDAVLFNHNVNPKGKIYDLNGIAYHRPNASIEQLVTKANFYSTEQARDLVRIRRKLYSVRVGLEIFIWFFKAFFIRRYFVFGFDGFIYSVIFAFSRFIRLAKARELAETLKNKY